MPLLSFDVYSNYTEVQRLRSEISMLENKLKTFKPGTSEATIRAVETQLKAARLQFRNLSLDAANAGAAVEMNIRKGANGAIEAVNELQQSLSNPISGLTKMAGLAGIGLFLDKVTQIRGQFQLMETSINTLLGSKQKGEAMMAQLTEYAKQSPLDFQGTVGAAQMMLGFGIQQDKILPFMKALGDVSMGDAQRFRSLTLAFSQMSAAGKLMGQDLMQMVNAGFQPLDQLAKDTGKSIGQLKEEMSNGKISAEMVQQAFINATSEGGKFYNMSQNAVSTISGQMSMLGDATDLMFNDIGKGAEGTILKVIEGATYIVEHWKEVAGVIGTAVATFGIYKASAMASEFAVKAAAEEKSRAIVQGFEEELAKMEEYRQQQAMMAYDEDIRTAISTGDISGDMADKIQSMRDELDLRIENAEAAKKAAEEEGKAALDAVNAAEERRQAIVEQISALNEDADSEERSTLEKELNGAVVEKNTALERVSEAGKKQATATTELQTLSEQKNTLSKIQNSNAARQQAVAETANTNAKRGGAIATALSSARDKVAIITKRALTAATTACSKAFNSMKVAFATNPFGLIITAITTLIGLFWTFSDEAEEVSADVERFGESAIKTKGNVETLYAVLASVNKNSKVYGDALDELTKIVKDYGFTLDDEKDKYEQLIGLRERLIQLIMEEGRQRQIANNIAAIQEEQKSIDDDFRNKLVEQIKGDNSDERVKASATIFAAAIQEAVQTSSEQVTALVEQINQLQSERDNAIKMAGITQGESQRHYLDIASENLRKIGALNRQLNSIVFQSANTMASNMGVQFNTDVNSAYDALSKYVIKLDAGRQALQAYTKAQEDSNAATEVAKQDTLTDYSTADTAKLLKTLTSVQSRITDLNKSGKSGVTLRVDSTQVTAAGEAADNTTQKVDAIDNNEQKPKVDASEVDNANTQAQKLVDKGTEIDNIWATPYIDTQYIDIALSKMGDLSNIIARLDGYQLKYYNLTDYERQLLQYAYNKYGSNTDDWPEQLNNAASQILTDSRERSLLKINGQTYNLTPEQSAIYQQLLNDAELIQGLFSGGIIIETEDGIDLDELKSINPELAPKIDKLKSTILMSSGELAQENWNYLTGLLDDKLKSTNTTAGFAELRKQVSSAMTNVAQDSQQYRYYENFLKQIDLYDRSKNTAEAQSQRAYERRKAMLQEEERTADAVIEERNRQTELLLAQMQESSEREIAQIHFNAQKKRQALERDLRKETERLKEYDRQQWVRGGQGRQAYQWVQTKSDEEYRSQAATNIGYDTQLALINTNEERDIQKRYREDATAMRNYLRDYGSFQQRKLAIAEDYAERIKRAQNDAERLTLERQRDADLRKVDNEALMAQINWYSVFDNVGIVLRGQLEPLYAQLKEYVQTDAFRQSGAENQREVINAMENIRQQLGETQSWRDLGTAMQDYQTALQTYQQALQDNEALLATQSADQQRYASAVNDAEKALNDLRASGTATDEQIQQAEQAYKDAKQAQTDYLNRVAESGKAVTEAQDNISAMGTRLSMTAKNVMQPVSKIYTFLNSAGLSQLAELWGAFDSLKGGINALKAIDKFAQATDKTAEATATLSEGMEQAAESIAQAGEDAAEAMSQIGESTADASEGVDDISKSSDAASKGLVDVPKELADGLEKSGAIAQIVSAALKILDILKDGIGNFVAQLLDTVYNAVIGIVDELLSGKTFSRIGESLYRGILGVFKSVFTLGGLLDWIGGGDSDKNYEKDIEMLANSNDALRAAIDDLSDELSKASVADAMGLYQQQIDYLKQSQANTQEELKRSGAAYNSGFFGVGGTHSSNKKIDSEMSAREWERISQITGQSVKSAADFWNLTSEQMAMVAQKAPDLYAKIKTFASQGYKDAAQFMDDYISYYKELEDLENSYRERLTDVSFGSVRDEFKSALLDMESTAEDFANNFESMMQQAVINSLVSSRYEPLIKNWYKQFSDFMEDGTLSADEQNRLKKEWDDIVNQGLNDRDAIVKALGWDGSLTQLSSSRSIASMSQDTGDAIEGRLTAIQLAVESIRNSEHTQAVSITELNDDLLQLMQDYSRFNVHYDNIENQMAKMYLELTTISENTGAIVQPIKTMQVDIAEIKRNTKNL